MNRYFYILLIYAAFSALALLSCNAPHENPLDPDNPSNKIYIIEGTLLTGELTPKPVVNALINWSPEKSLASTDNNGYFKIYCSGQTDGWLRFEKTGFSPDSVLVSWNGQKTVVVQPRLNYLPVVDTFNIYSSIKNKYSKAEYQLFFDVTLHDPDDDITSVTVENKALSINKALTKITSTYFEGRFSDIELGITAFDEIVGRRFDLIVNTATGDTFTLAGSSVVRIIKDEIEVISPKNSDTLTTRTPTLNWLRLTPGFSFTYTVEVYTDETEPVLQWRKENLSADEISANVDTPINPTVDNDRFFWVIWCIDNYKNKSRSKPAGFVVK